MFALTVQDRVIRLEMRLRLRELLPADLQPRIHELDTASARRAALRQRPRAARADAQGARRQADDAKAIKLLIQEWHADHLRAWARVRRVRRRELDSVIHAVDLHACGEPGRVIIGGVLDVPGGRCSRRCSTCATHQDGLRKRMLREPRGYPAANCNLVLPPTHPDADAGFVIMEQVEYPPMSGTNTICVDDGAARNRDGADARAGHGADARSAGRADPRARGLPRRQGHAGDVPQRAGVRGPSRRRDRRADARTRRGRRRLGRHVLCHRRRRAVRPRADAGRGTRHHAHRRDDQGRRARAASGRAPGQCRRSAM